MPFLFALLALLVPRITIVLLWLYTTWFQGVFNTTFWPLLGFLFLPLTLLWYSAVMHFFGGHWTALPIIGMVIAVLLDLSSIRFRRRRTETVVP